MLRPHLRPRLTPCLLLGLTGWMGCRRLSSPRLQEHPGVFSIYIWVKFRLNLLQSSHSRAIRFGMCARPQGCVVWDPRCEQQSGAGPGGFPSTSPVLSSSSKPSLQVFLGPGGPCVGPGKTCLPLPGCPGPPGLHGPACDTHFGRTDLFCRSYYIFLHAFAKAVSLP